jgi:hypothetical protein
VRLLNLKRGQVILLERQLELLSEAARNASIIDRPRRRSYDKWGKVVKANRRQAGLVRESAMGLVSAKH